MAGVHTIDISPFRLDDPSGMTTVATQVARSCEETGFLVVTGHGVPASVIDALDTASRKFFALPLAVKQTSVSVTGRYGYSAPAAEALAQSLDLETPPDLKESFTVGDPTTFDLSLWPAQVPEMVEAWVRYDTAMAGLADGIMSIFAVALGLPPTYFAPYLDAPLRVLRVISYPAQEGIPQPGQLRAGEHSDYGTLTILRAEAVPGGLEVKDKRGAWHPVNPPPGSFVVNIGDMMAMWTNDRWVSTMHRVGNPPPGAVVGDRLSLVFFHQPNGDAVIAPLETCVDAEHPAKYAPVSCREWLEAKVAKQKAVPRRSG